MLRRIIAGPDSSSPLNQTFDFLRKYKKGGKVKKKAKYTQKQKQNINIHIDNSRKTNPRKPYEKPSGKTMPVNSRPQFTTQIVGSQTPTQPLNLTEITRRLSGIESKINQPQVLGNNVLYNPASLSQFTSPPPINAGPLDDADGKEEKEAAQPAPTEFEPGFVERATSGGKKPKGEYIDTGVDYVQARGKSISIFTNLDKTTLYFHKEGDGYKNLGEKKIPADKMEGLKTLLINKGMFNERATRQPDEEEEEEEEASSASGSAKKKKRGKGKNRA